MAAPLHLADLVNIAMPALIKKHGSRLTAHQRHALRAIAECRTSAFGATTMVCPDCGTVKPRLRSCGNRSCPRCQHHTARQWLERQHAKLLPIDYFLATFTLPKQLRPIAYRYPKAVYPALFSAVAATLKSFGLNHPGLHADIGFCTVLHTHSRRLDYHPHLHVVIPGGGIDKRTARMRLWRKLEGQYLFNAFALAKVFRAKMLDALVRAGIDLPTALPTKWVVHCKHVGRGLPVLKYLSRYLYRGVLSERDLLRYDEQRQTVTFRYREAKTQRMAHRTLPIADFLWRIALHVLPKGLQRVRSYGFLHGNARRLLALVQLALRVLLPHRPDPQSRPYLCSACGAPMQVGGYLPPLRRSG